MDPKLITPILFGALIVWSMYRRVRRNIGRQPLTPLRMQLRIGILGIIGGIILFTSLRDMNLFGAMLAGIAGGAVLALFGLRHTKFESTPAGKFYTPHTWIGVFVSVLLIGRILYRFAVIGTSMQGAGHGGDPFADYQKSPLTLAILGVVVGYYVAYYIGVLIKARDLPAATDTVTVGITPKP